jgi:hypothetical protein
LVALLGRRRLAGPLCAIAELKVLGDQGDVAGALVGRRRSAGPPRRSPSSRFSATKATSPARWSAAGARPVRRGDRV